VKASRVARTCNMILSWTRWLQSTPFRAVALNPIVILFSHLHPAYQVVSFFSVLCISVRCIFSPKKFCRMLSISQCYKFVFSAALSTQSRLFHVNRNGEVYAKYCVFTHDIYCVVAVFMGRHVPFYIVISCISPLLDSVFFTIEPDYRNTHNH
jgi:hypothetical protein